MVLTVEVPTGKNTLLRFFRRLLLVLEGQDCAHFSDFSLKIMPGTQQGCRTSSFGGPSGEYYVLVMRNVVITEKVLKKLIANYIMF